MYTPRKIDFESGQVDMKNILVAMGVLFAGFVVISVMDEVVTGVGLPSNIEADYNATLETGGLLLKIGIYGLIMAIVWVLFLRG